MRPRYVSTYKFWILTGNIGPFEMSNFPTPICEKRTNFPSNLFMPRKLESVWCSLQIINREKDPK